LLSLLSILLLLPYAKHFQVGLGKVVNGKATAPTSMQQVISVDEAHSQTVRWGLKRGEGGQKGVR